MTLCGGKIMPTKRSLLSAVILSLLFMASTYVPAVIIFCYNKYPWRRCSCFFVIHVSLSCQICKCTGVFFLFVGWFSDASVRMWMCCQNHVLIALKVVLSWFYWRCICSGDRSGYVPVYTAGAILLASLRCWRMYQWLSMWSGIELPEYRTMLYWEMCFNL